MNKFLIGAAALAVSLPALAQVAPMAGNQQTRAEVVAKAQKHFAMMDTNRDGAIVADEMSAMGGQRHGARGNRDMAMHDGPMGNPGAMFDRLDANHDGSISRDEFARGHQMRVERKVVINGAPGDEHAGMKMHGMGGAKMGGGMGRHMLKMADANNDGRITLPEMTNAALQRFDRADTNHDGVVTKDERQAMHHQMMQQRGQTL
ncbi:MAG: EF-hand domain-containing protein [Sphingomicrobium sp.]